MKPSTFRRLLILPAFVAFSLAGCSQGTTQDTVSTAPPLTKENMKSAVDDVNAGAGSMKPSGKAK